MKTCNKCNLKKDLSLFYKDVKAINGVRTICKSCENLTKIEYRQLDSSKQRRREYEKKYYKERRKTDPFFKLRKDFSSIIRRKLKGSKNNNCIWNFLPYSVEELKQHIEKQFDDKMSWENHGSYWHIDHIIAQIHLPYDSMNHLNFQKCWALDNLQPLEKFENLYKSDKLGANKL